jgi:hypothetical protein
MKSLRVAERLMNKIENKLTGMWSYFMKSMSKDITRGILELEKLRGFLVYFLKVALNPFFIHRICLPIKIKNSGSKMMTRPVRVSVYC